MNVLILEDEKAAATRLQQLMTEVAPAANVTAVIEGVRAAVVWLTKNPAPDIILSDIQLADGLSFDVFQQVSVTAPVIFITAYDAYTLKAFKLNSIDYLLKPIDKDELRAAFVKYENLHKTVGVSRQMLDMFQNIAAGRSGYKSRFMIRQGDRLLTIPVEDVAFIQADDKVIFLHTRKGNKYIIDDTLDELETMMDPKVFFRLNRTYIAPLYAIDKISHHFNGRLKISLAGCPDNEIFVSRARVAAFKQWLNK